MGRSNKHEWIIDEQLGKHGDIKEQGLCCSFYEVWDYVDLNEVKYKGTYESYGMCLGLSSFVMYSSI